jgi:RND family efflux transporter MFP subunit
MEQRIDHPGGAQAGRADERRHRRIAWLAGAAGLAAVCVLVGYGALSHAQRSARAEQTLQREQTRVPVVRTQPVKTTRDAKQIELSGNMEAFDSSTLFARATGYVAKRNVDIGSRVHAGDLLAQIAAPDLDQQLAQARAQLTQLQAALNQAQANQELARKTNERTSQLVREGWSSQQQGDQDRQNFKAQSASVGVAQANLDAQRAQVARLEKLTGFERVTAPFDGVITARQVDVGSLVTADTANGTPLFAIARTNTLRVQVYVPQEDAFGIKDGLQAQVLVPEMPDRTFHGTVARNARALQAGTRTLLAEVDIDNSDGVLYPGLYSTVRFQVPRPQPVFTVPAEAIIFDRNGLSVAVVEDGKARIRRIELAADDGAQVDVKQGLRPGDRIILSPPVNLSDGMPVTATDAPPK